jgi:hypothetical protein
MIWSVTEPICECVPMEANEFIYYLLVYLTTLSVAQLCGPKWFDDY